MATGGIVPGEPEPKQFTFEPFMTTLANAYNTERGNTYTLSKTICHSSCHGSCHGSRGRR